MKWVFASGSSGRENILDEESSLKRYHSRTKLDDFL